MASEKPLKPSAKYRFNTPRFFGLDIILSLFLYVIVTIGNTVVFLQQLYADMHPTPGDFAFTQWLILGEIGIFLGSAMLSIEQKEKA